MRDIDFHPTISGPGSRQTRLKYSGVNPGN